MSAESEDLNEFNSWDILGAMLMLTLVPGIMNYVFNDKDIVSSAVIVGVGVVISLAVFGFSLLVRGRVISKIVNLLGTVLTTIYVVIAVYFWGWHGDEEAAAAADPPTVQQ